MPADAAPSTTTPLRAYPAGLGPTTRGLALFLGTFALASTLREFLVEGSGTNHWWIDLRGLPAGLGDLWCGSVGLLLAFAAVRPHPGPLRRRVTAIALAVSATVAVADTARVVWLAATGRVDAFPVPVSALVAATLALLAVRVLRENSGKAAGMRVPAVAVTAATVFALAQMVAFGHTDYRRDADAIVVLGARANADGTASQALRERVHTACALYHQGLAPLLFMSGGRGPNGVAEVDVMRRLARDDGVPDAAILLDPQGVNSRATVANTAGLAARRGLRRVLVVSHAYHLPRLKMAFERTPVEAFTVPAQEERTMWRLPWFMAREVAALWVDFVRS